VLLGLFSSVLIHRWMLIAAISLSLPNCAAVLRAIFLSHLTSPPFAYFSIFLVMFLYGLSALTQK